MALGPYDRHCHRTACPCTHEAPCDRGWVDAPDDKATPCSTCRPDLAVAVRSAETRRELLRNVAAYRRELDVVTPPRRRRDLAPV